MADKEVRIKILGDNSGLDKSLKDSEEAVGSFGSKAGAIMKAAAVAFAAVTAAAVKMLDSFIDADQIFRKTEAIIRATGGAAGITADQAAKLATQMSRLTKFDDEAVLSAENLLLTFRNISGDVLPAATRATLDMAEAMGTDAVSAAQLLGKSLNNPEIGISILRRSGIVFTEAQRDLIKAMVNSGNVAEAQGIILQELTKKYGGVAEAAAQGTGVYRQLKNSLGDVMEAGGKVVDQYLNPAAVAFKNFINASLDSGRVEGAFVAIAESIKSFGSFAYETFKNLSDTIYNTIGDERAARIAKNFSGIGDGLKVVFEVLGKAILYVSDLIRGFVVDEFLQRFSAIVTAVDAVGVAISYLKVGFVNFFASVDKFPLMLTDLWLGFKETALEAVKAVIDTLNEGIAKAQEAAAKIPGLGKLVGEPTGSAGLTSASNSIDEKLKGIGAERNNIGQQLASKDFAARQTADNILRGSGSGSAEGNKQNGAGDEAAAVDSGTQKALQGLPVSDAELEAMQKVKELQNQATLEAEKKHKEEMAKVLSDYVDDTEEEMDDAAAAEIERNDSKNAMLLQNTGEYFRDLATLTYAFGAKGKALQKTLSIANATISIAEGIAKAQTLAFPLNIREALRIAAVGATQFAAIKGAAQGTIVGGFDTGRDNQLMAVRSGEMIVTPDLVEPIMPTLRDIVRKEDKVGGGMGGSSQAVEVVFRGDAARMFAQINKEAKQSGVI